MSSTKALNFWSLSDVGRERDHNEDSLLIDEDLGLFICADGMGGHAAGEVASSMASRTIRDVLAAEATVLRDYAEGSERTSRIEVLRLLESSVQRACTTVYEQGVLDETKRGMGTTVDALLIVANRGFIAHVGDSRIYLHRQGSTHQLTEDHSLINELLKRGRLTRAQIEKIHYKNAVTRAVGVYENVEVDVFDFDVLAGDSFLLCSDGLSGYLQDGELSTLFEDCAHEDLARHLIDLANSRGGRDNITAIVVHIPVVETGIDRLAREVHLKIELLHQMPLFRLLNYQELVRVLNSTSVCTFDAGASIVREGEEGDALFIVLEGEVRVHAGETTIANFGSGQHFGEMALLDKSSRSASVTSRTDSKLLCIRRAAFFDLVRNHHDLAVKLLWSFLGVLSQRLRLTSKELQEIKQQFSV
ncbi:MAG: Stp1/IreP family PP2C-type Ser/Thr phosphatase [Myxococcota bacterium]